MAMNMRINSKHIIVQAASAAVTAYTLYKLGQKVSAKEEPLQENESKTIIEVTKQVERAEVVIPCSELDPTLAFFTEKLGFRVAEIIPADAPSEVVIVGHGLRIRLQCTGTGEPGIIRLLCKDTTALAKSLNLNNDSCPYELIAPNGTRVQLSDADPPLDLPSVKQSFHVSRLDSGEWGVGRAGMRYRDLVPDRQGGRFIVSHIHIPTGGPVPDYVHFHKVHFQMIYCYKGWVRVVYEDQGESFIMHEGDCVLQPPKIRHRVLESSDGLEVIEITSPAIHSTFGDLHMTLPTGNVHPERDFSGQRFVRHEVASAKWKPWRLPGFEARDLGIGNATNDVARVCVARYVGGDLRPQPATTHDMEFFFIFVLKGSLTVICETTFKLAAGDSFTIPSNIQHTFLEYSNDLELLEILLPMSSSSSFKAV